MKKEESKKEIDKNKEIQPKNVVHGVKLRQMLVYLETELGWEEMGNRIKINCFMKNPTMGSSLTFLKRTSWAKEQVQELYIDVKTNGKNSTNFVDSIIAKSNKIIRQKPIGGPRKPSSQKTQIVNTKSIKAQPQKESGTKELSDFIQTFNKKIK